MTDATQDWFEKILANPAAEYAAPSEVLTDERLTGAQKKTVLAEWELDAARLEESVAEGMGGGEANKLMEVKKARLALDCMA
ncbi:MAG: hypothetical protein JNM47_08915 [Hyphomonadaceae bacterium]|nr:hypothetical protein [Hyphomonadaceae bacterium]